MEKGQKLRTYEGRQVALWPSKNMRITQGMYGECPDGTIYYSHKESQAIDFNTRNYWDEVYAPYDCKIVYVSTGYNTIFFESLEPVHMANLPEGYQCLKLLHDNDITGMTVGKVFKQGEKIYDEGGKGPEGTGQYASHVHLETFIGRYKERKACSPVDVFFVNATNLIEPMKYAWKTYTGKTWEDKLADDAAAEAKRLADAEAARLEAERLAKLEAERLAAEEAARIEAERLAKLEAERLAAEEAARLEAQRLAALEQERLAKLEQERLAKLEAERIENERIAAEKAKAEELRQKQSDAYKQRMESLVETKAKEKEMLSKGYKVGDKVKIIGETDVQGYRPIPLQRAQVHQIANVDGDKVLLVAALSTRGNILGRGIYRWFYVKDIKKV